MSLIGIVNLVAACIGLVERAVAVVPRVINALTPSSKADPRDIAISTKSAVSADREGKIASARSKASLRLRRLGDYGPSGE